LVANSPPERDPLERFDGLVGPVDAGHANRVSHRLVHRRVHAVEVPVAHLVPVVLGQLELGRPRQAHLTGGHQVVEPAVGPALDREETDQLVPACFAGEPAVGGREAVACGQHPHPFDGVGGQAGRQRHGLQLGHPACFEACLQRGDGGGSCVPGGVTENGQGSCREVVDGQQGKEAVAPVDGVAGGEYIEGWRSGGEGGAKALRQRLAVIR